MGSAGAVPAADDRAVGVSIPRPCLDCRNMATKDGRCDSCRRARQSARNRKPSRAIYGGSWRAVSKKAREEQPFCSVCYATDDLTLDHTTGMVVCRSCHLSEKQGGVFRARSRAYG